MNLASLKKINQKQATVFLKDIENLPASLKGMGGSITLRLLYPQERDKAAFAAFNTTYQLNKDGEQEAVSNLDPLGSQMFIYENAVVSFNDMYEDEEEKVPMRPTRANKLKLAALLPGVVGLVVRAHTAMVEEQAGEQAEEQKN